MNNNKKKSWTKPRHRLVRHIAAALLSPIVRFKYRAKVTRFREDKKRQYLILFNHQTAFDQFFVGLAFRQPVYYIASEDLFSKGFLSSLIRFLVAPIPIRKQTTDVRAVLNCIKVAKEGGTIALAPEGNRTFSGRTGYMNPAVAALSRKLGLPILLFRIEGGYGAQPRWSDVIRRGNMRCYVSRVIEPEEYGEWDNERLLSEICRELYLDEGGVGEAFRHKRRAEFLERAIYVCPECGLSRFESHGALMSCKGCGLTVEYGEDKRITAVKGALPFGTVAEWYGYQCGFVNRLDPRELSEEALYSDLTELSEVIVYKKKKRIAKRAQVLLFGDRIALRYGDTETDLPFDEVGAITVLGRNKLNLYHRDRIYQLKGDKRFNALRHLNIFHRYKNVTGGKENDEFLGL